MKWKPTIQINKERMLKASHVKGQSKILNFTSNPLFMFTKKENEKMKITKEEAKEFETIEDGKHDGFIVDVKLREKPYAYLDFYLSVDDLKREDGSPLTLKASYPAKLTADGFLSKALDRLEFEIKVGEEMDTDDLKGIAVTYMTMNEHSEKDDKDYSNVINKTVKKREL